MKFPLRLTICLLVLMMLLSVAAFAAPAPESGFAFCVADTSLRPEPESLDALAALSAGKPVRVLGLDRTWAFVSCKGQVGYVPTALLSGLPEGDMSLGVGFAWFDETNVLASPAADSPLVARLNMGTAAAITGVYGGYYQLGNANGEAVGYVARQDLLLQDYPGSAWEADFIAGTKLLTQDTPIYLGKDKDVQALADELVNLAMEYLGCPYRWGGSGPSSFDCSGFVSYVYRQFGYTLERVANDIYLENGTLVSLENLQAGDVVCFTNTYSTRAACSHVGIYIGDGQFIHASERGVKISQIDGDYYLDHFLCGKRILATGAVTPAA